MTNWAPVVGLTAVAAALRLLALGSIPPGLYHDEAFNGLDALGVLAGKTPIYFAANRGREPVFIYLVAVTVGLLGRTPGALRLAAAVSGTLTVPATYLMAREWLGRRIALLSAAIIATTMWHVHLSRVGFRAVTLPMAIAVMLWLGAKAFYSRRRELWLLTGLLYGATFYTYVPARFTPFVLIGFASYVALTREGDRLWPGALYFSTGALLALVPLAAYSVKHWEVIMGRPGEVSVFNPLINGGDLWGTLGSHLLRTLGMFFVRGDTIPRHNLAGRPAFDPLMAVAMVWGTIRALRRARRRDAASALTLIWVGLMLVPTWLAEDAPHFLRAVGVLPPLVILPALGLEGATSWLQKRGQNSWALILMGGMLTASTTITAWDHFVRYPADPDTAFAFEEAATTMASEVNNFLGSGWDGTGILASSLNPRSSGRVHLDRRLWDEWASIAFLIPEAESVTMFSEDTPPEPSAPALLIVWPHDGLAPYLRGLPRDSRIAAHAGPLTRGDLQEGLYTAYVAYTVEPLAKHPTDHIANFSGEIALADYSIERRQLTWTVKLEWIALTGPRDNYTVSVHLFRGGRLVAQDDAEPADGYYPTALWREGDVVADEHVLKLPDAGSSDGTLAIGMYVWPTMRQLEARDSNGTSLGPQVSLPATSPSSH
ncbi:MAG: glycosyltransferase family 39 protein [Anaerolineae bacterium]